MPAGVCQNAEDRVDTDPQLRHLNWLTEVTGTKIGTWPVYEIPMKLSQTPAYIGGPINRGAPCYGEDNMYVLTELLGTHAAGGRAARRGGRHLMQRTAVPAKAGTHSSASSGAEQWVRAFAGTVRF